VPVNDWISSPVLNFKYEISDKIKDISDVLLNSPFTFTRSTKYQEPRNTPKRQTASGKGGGGSAVGVSGIWDLTSPSIFLLAQGPRGAFLKKKEEGESVGCFQVGRRT
jgi:hypothetical protein